MLALKEKGEEFFKAAIDKMIDLFYEICQADLEIFLIVKKNVVPLSQFQQNFLNSV